MRNAKRRNRLLSGLLLLLAVVTICAAVLVCVNDPFDWRRSDKEMEISDFAKKNGISISDYPKELIDLYERNDDTRQFVLEYPLKKDAAVDIDLSGEDLDTVPLLMQWDQRWGYSGYGNGMIGLNGCGPVCLSMVALYLKNDTGMNPKWMADFSSNNGYYVKDNGTAWALMSEGAGKIGITSTELPLEESIVKSELESGHPIICIMGEGDFTREGHYIVLTGYYNGKVSVNDPNSYKNSEKLWNFSDIKDQIRNLWSYSV